MLEHGTGWWIPSVHSNSLCVVALLCSTNTACYAAGDGTKHTHLTRLFLTPAHDYPP